ncbi:amidophosphoribosyltransferase [Euzebya tangerina]|uniref:amidophosphoribosyltransferase n=1 Tax=Euzebya tangerina TaxID=591198 RepID=UPI00196B8782|nr:amidophosphoribosyltransferase [Euzebya tangerina]
MTADQTAEWGKEGPKDACGVFGVFAPSEHAAKLCYYGLYALQHRGQESAGIAVSDGTSILVTKEMGLVNQVFDDGGLDALEGHLGIGHVRYSTTGASTWDNAQPTFRSTPGGHVISLGHNGNLTNTRFLSGQLQDLRSARAAALRAGGILDQLAELPGDKCSSDSDLLSALISETRDELSDGGTMEALQQVLPNVDGAFSLVVMDETTIYGARDPQGVRPLVIGRLKSGGWVIASETAALDIVGASRVRDVEPGEVVAINADGFTTARFADARPKSCVFEYIYVARPDHMTEETTIYGARRRMGELLAEEAPVQADLVIPVPDSGLAAAGGYSAASGIPYAEGLTKNRYVGRTFIQPTQSLRQLGIRLKLNPIVDIIEGKRLVVVDDSIVRGNTSRQLIQMLKTAGASEVHLRITAPPIKWPCFYGIDFPTRAELIAGGLAVEEIRTFLRADSLAYLSMDGLIETTKLPASKLCMACLDGNYPIPVEELQRKDGKAVMATLFDQA